MSLIHANGLATNIHSFTMQEGHTHHMTWSSYGTTSTFRGINPNPVSGSIRMHEGEGFTTDRAISLAIQLRPECY